jgi:hypothetical protein
LQVKRELPARGIGAKGRDESNDMGTPANARLISDEAQYRRAVSALL